MGTHDTLIDGERVSLMIASGENDGYLRYVIRVPAGVQTISVDYTNEICGVDRSGRLRCRISRVVDSGLKTPTSFRRIESSVNIGSQTVDETDRWAPQRRSERSARRPCD